MMFFGDDEVPIVTVPEGMEMVQGRLVPKPKTFELTPNMVLGGVFALLVGVYWWKRR